MTKYRNATVAFKHLLSRVGAEGANVTVRNGSTMELQSQLIEISRPKERCIVVPGRKNNIFATIAETVWMLSGGGEIAFLEGYLKRAEEFSDDGLTWRAAYGPRLRNWNGIDQLEAVRSILMDDPSSRRAVISLYDPDRDFTISKDIPCNNWLHFLVRDGKLHLNVAARSTDLIWGFSAINAFQWSVLQEMMAHWLNVQVGEFRFFTSSLHLYDRHYKLLSDIDVDSAYTIYDNSPSLVGFSTGWADFDDSLKRWLAAEESIRHGEAISSAAVRFTDPLLDQFIQMIDIYWTYKRGNECEALDVKIAKLGKTDYALAAREYVKRNQKPFD